MVPSHVPEDALGAFPPPPPSPVRPSPGRSPLLRFIHDRNPFFLLSALSMFTGYRIILGAIDAQPGDLQHLLVLIATLNVYEALLIALGLFLIVRRGLTRDGWFLLSIEALFLVDLTNLNAEFFTANYRLGSAVNAACFVLALVKIYAVVRTLRLRVAPTTALYIAAQLALLLGLPGVFRMISFRAAVTPMQIYGVWWMVGLLIAAGALLVRRPEGEDRSPMAALPWRLYVLVPLVSLLVHLCGENRVYWVHFQIANLGPVLLAIAFALAATRARRHPLAPTAAGALTVLAILVSVVPAADQVTMMSHFGAVRISPLRLALIGAAALSTHVAWRQRSLLAAQFAAACAALASLGATVPDMVAHASRLAHRGYTATSHGASAVTPTTPLQWGYAAVAAAFLLLGLGAIVSLRQGGPSMLPDEPAPGEPPPA